MAVDRAEVKLTLTLEALERAQRLLGVDPQDSDRDTEAVQFSHRDVVFVDTDDGDLAQAHAIVRARYSQKRGDVTVKFRPAEDSVVAQFAGLDGFEVEQDHVPGRAPEDSLALRVRVDPARLQQALSGEVPWSDVLTQQQQQLLIAGMPQRSLGWEELHATPPAHVRKWEAHVAELGGEASLELWTLPDGQTVLELSMDCQVDQAASVEQHLRQLVGSQAEARQATKTQRMFASLEPSDS